MRISKRAAGWLVTLVAAGFVWPLADPGLAVTDEEQRPRPGESVATFAGGCFWCTESDFEKLPGVTRVLSGYSGGKEKNPTYKEVSAGATGHVEAVQVFFDASKVSYGQLLDFFWRHIDPTDAGGQFVDRGRQYRSAIFYHDEAQKMEAQASKERLAKSGVFGTRAIVTEIQPFAAFYLAEDYHQDYYKTNPVRYNYYRFGSGRDQFLKKTWGDKLDAPPGDAVLQSGTGSGPSGQEFAKPQPASRTAPQSGAGAGPGGAAGWSPASFVKPSDAQLKARLTPMQYKVTQHEGTEPPFKNEYNDNKRPGIYVDIVSGEPLFASVHKYDSGTGWPSFYQPLESGNIATKEDRSLFSVRIEVRSKHADSHLGHVFGDGPPPTGLRYCMNSAALRFIPAEDLEKEGYGQYAKLFK